MRRTSIGAGRARRPAPTTARGTRAPDDRRPGPRPARDVGSRAVAPDAAPRLVRPREARAAVAAGPRPVPGARQRVHAPADAGRRGDPVLRALDGTLADARGAGGRGRRRRARRVVGPRLLPPRP